MTLYEMSNSENPVKRGTTIFKTKPFAYVLISNCRTSRCDYCFESGKLFKCSSCEYVYYCNRACQRRSWPIHKVECTNLKRVSPKVIPNIARLMARIIIKLNDGGDEEVGYYSETGYKRFTDLMSHYSNIKKDEKRLEHFTCIYWILTDFLEGVPMPNAVELMAIYGRICINSFIIYDLDMNAVGIGIYLAPSVLDHSCAPNSIITFEGPTIIIRTIEDLPCFDWSKITVSYIDVFKTTEERREQLKSFYYFWCNCKKCEQPEPAAKAAMCPNKFCTYPCPSDANICKKCNEKFPENFKKTFDEVSDFTAHHLQNMNNMAYLDVSKACLRKQEGVMHPLNMQHMQTLQTAFDSAILLQHWEEAESYAKRLLNGYLLYYGEINLLTGMLYLMMGKLQLYLGKPKEALKALKIANSILMITHEDKHALIQKSLKPLLYQATMEGSK